MRHMLRNSQNKRLWREAFHPLTKGAWGEVYSFWIHTHYPHHLILNSVIDPKG
jgi:hypothetical protein